MAQRVMVIGAGLMGSGIAQVSAVAGLEVTMRDVTDVALHRGRDAIEKSLARFASKGRISDEEVEAALARVSVSTDLDAAGEADVVVEAVFEDLEVKRELFGALDQICRPGAVLASNTSAIP
ncbi:MAG: 3-hydroxyacyl-CoA dehydrogenase family protein, partial [Jatrophihabitans sp.]